ncbi:benzoate/H(+) symporter BenE family transporter [Xanthobacter autotrophicus DSM 431]|uniref:benzoate/H(+) symporter BenE family transporter n=1 Tax=Xanthobacter nonsaccharivorans TaxID=3119912 RepID=UPI003729066C
MSLIVSAIVATLVGLGNTLTVIPAAAGAIGATPAETSSWIASICISVAATSAFLSVRYRMPIVAAWSLPGAAMVASFGPGADMATASGAFVVAGALMAACAAIRPLGTLVSRIPGTVAAAMLAGVLLRFVTALADNAAQNPLLILPVIVIYFVMRRLASNWAVLGAFVFGTLVSLVLSEVGPIPAPQLSPLVWTTPRFEASTLVGLGLPLFLVTFAAQNLPGFAVLRASGYAPPIRPILATMGLASVVSAPFGAHATNLAALTAALCTGRDTHPDPRKRWVVGIVFGGFHLVLAAAGASLVGVFAAFPQSFVATIAGLALLSPLSGSLTAALAENDHRIAAVATFATTASGISVLGLGSPVWGLGAGLFIMLIDRWRRSASFH